MGVFAAIANRLGRKAPTNPPRNRGLAPVIRPLPLSQQYQRIGGSLTPLQVSSIIQEADSGSLLRLIDLANEFRQKDCHLQAILGTREGALAGLPWVVEAAIVPGAAQPTKRELKVAEFVSNALRYAEGRGQDSRSFIDTLSHLAGASYHGFAVSEIEWAKDGSSLVPVGFRPVSQRRFIFSSDDGALLWWDSYGRRDPVNLSTSYPDKFIIHQPRINGDVPCREGLARVLMWASLFRNWTTADWMKLAELSWKPWRLGTYKPSASTEDIDNLVEALELLATNGFAVHSEAVDIHVEWPERNRGGQSGHGELCEFMAKEMSKAVLGQTLTVEQGARGARSLGEVHDRVRKDIAESDAVAMAATIRRDLIGPIVRMNFGSRAIVPDFHFITEDIPDMGGLARGVEGLVRAGMRIPQWWVRDKLGMPELSEDDEILDPNLFAKPVAAPVAEPAPDDGDDDIPVDMEDGEGMPDAAE